MVLTSSTMLPTNTKAPDFSLPDINGKMVSISDFNDSKAYLIAFICVHCPYVKHLEKEFSQLAKEYLEKGVTVIAINSNDPNYDSDDDLSGMQRQAERLDFLFPYLVDKTQEIAKSYKAACTPDFFLFDQNKNLVYRGQFDDTRPGMGNPDGKDLKEAINSVLENKPMSENQKPSSGCNIKWKPNNQPDYFN